MDSYDEIGRPFEPGRGGFDPDGVQMRDSIDTINLPNRVRNARSYNSWRHSGAVLIEAARMIAACFPPPGVRATWARRACTTMRNGHVVDLAGIGEPSREVQYLAEGLEAGNQL